MRGNRVVKYIEIFLGIPLLIFFGFLKIFKKRKIAGRINKILVIKLSALGDTVLLIPVIRTIRENFPDAKISMIITEINRNVAENCNYINELLEFKTKEFIKNPLKLLRFIKKIRNKNFDIVIDADQWLRISALLSFLSGAKRRIGFKTKGQFKHFTFTDVVFHKKNKHELECFFDLIEPLNLKIKNKSLEFNIKNEKLIEAEKILKVNGIAGNERFIIIHPEVPAHGFQRQWPLENFIKLIEEIIKKYNVKILITGTKKINSLTEKIPERVKEKTKFVFDIPIDLLSAIISKSLFLVCNNTGIMHLSCAIGTPVIALHGPTDPIKWGPVGEKNITIKSSLYCSPCLYLGFEYRCKTNKCMKTITVEEVMEKVDRMLKFII